MYLRTREPLPISRGNQDSISYWTDIAEEEKRALYRSGQKTNWGEIISKFKGGREGSYKSRKPLRRLVFYGTS